MKYGSFTIEGPKGSNQDRLLEPIALSFGWLAAIADGVGGNAGGAIAAEAAMQSVSEAANGNTIDADAIFDRACRLIKEASAQSEGLSRMATTLSMVWVESGVAYAAHVGDTRVYHARGNGLVTKTEDQTEVAQLLREKVLTPAQAKRYPRRNVITSYLSSNADFDIFYNTFDVTAGDKIILLTDGAYHLVKKAEIINYINTAPSIEVASRTIAQHIIEAGPKVDSSGVIIEV